MFYLIVIVTLVLYVLIKAINTTRAQEPTLFFLNGSVASFFKFTALLQVFFFIWSRFFISPVVRRPGDVCLRSYPRGEAEVVPTAI